MNLFVGGRKLKTLRLFFVGAMLMSMIGCFSNKISGSYGDAGTANIVFSMESLGDGSGTVYSSINLPINDSLTLYAVVRDTNGDYIRNTEVSWQLTGGVGTLLIASAGKSATFNAETTPGTNQISMIVNGEVKKQVNVTVYNSAHLAFTASPVSAANFSSLGTVTVEIRDSDSNLEGSATNLVTLSISTDPSGNNAAFLSSGIKSISTNAIGGIATFTNVSIDEPGTGFILTASATGYSSADSGLFNVTGARKVYRSVGPGSTTPVDSSGGNLLNLTGKIASFDSALASNIGVGDVLQYDSDGGGNGNTVDAVDSVAIITYRISSTQFFVKTPGLGVPPAAVADQDWSVCRAHLSLNSAENLLENTACLDDALGALENLDADNDGRDLAANNEQWHIALYADGADTTMLNAETGWTTSAENYVRIFAPQNANEVGVSQRHSGVWDSTKSRFVVNEYFNNFNDAGFAHFRVEGLQLENTYSANAPSSEGGIIEFSSGAPGSQVYFTNNILRKTTSYANPTEMAISGNTTNTSIYLANNIIYGFKRGLDTFGSATTHYIYNNSFANYNDFGLRLAVSGADVNLSLKNNVVVDDNASGADYTIVGSPTTLDAEYNLSVDGTAPGTNTQTGTPLFFDYENKDFRLASTDTLVKGNGLDLTGDANFSITDDAIGTLRSAPFDLGALAYIDKSGLTLWNEMGQGTSEQPYLLFNKNQLEDLAQNGCDTSNTSGCTANFTLIEDIDFGGSNWSYIGDTTGAERYAGIFNGNGRTISNIVYPDKGSTVGFFPATCNATIKNITLANVTYTGNDNTVGGVVGVAYCDLQMDNVHTTGASLFADVNSNIFGGLIGQLAGSFTVANSHSELGLKCFTNCGGAIGTAAGGNGSLSNVYATGDITSKSSNGGGLVGSMSGNNTMDITGSYATGDVIGESATHLGGLIGSYTAQGIVLDSYATGNITNTTGDNAGGLAGELGNTGTIDSCYALGNVSSLSNAVGGLVGVTSSSGNITNSWAGGNINGASYIGGLVGDASGTGQISNSFARGDVVGTSNAVGGLVGRTASSGGVAESYALGDVSGAGNIGGGVGMLIQPADVADSFAMGDVRATGNYVGGFTGYETGWGGYHNRNFATGDVFTSGNTAGGFSGRNETDIYDSYATGNVSGNANVGGFSGVAVRIYRSFALGNANGVSSVSAFGGDFRNGQAPYDSYALGDATGSSRVGGLIGNSFSYGVFNEVYHRGVVRGDSEVGGLLGHADHGPHDDSFAVTKVINGNSLIGAVDPDLGDTYTTNYWNSDINSADGSDVAASVAGQYQPLTTAQMKLESSYSGFNFVSMWVMVDGKYPVHRWSPEGKCLLNPTTITHDGIGAGSISDPYILCRKAQLEDLALNGCSSGNPGACSNNYRLGADIDLRGTDPGMIGDAANCLSGRFDGYHKSIRNYTRTSTANTQALFACVSGLIMNLKIENATLNTDHTNNAILVADLSGSILNTHIQGQIIAGSSANQIGGFVGFLNGDNITIAHSSFNGSISTLNTGTGRYGGIIGSNSSDANKKNVLLKNESIVEFIGSGLSSGGQAGLGSNLIIKKAYSRVKSNASHESIGAITGTSGFISQSIGIADVTSTGSGVGGIAGLSSKISDSMSISKTLSGSDLVGGLLGDAQSWIVTDSYARTFSLLSGASLHGVIDGTAHAGSANNYWDSDTSGVSAESSAGKYEPLATVDMDNAANFSGWDFTNTWFVGEDVRSPLLQWHNHPDCIANPTAVTHDAIGSGTAGTPYKICFKEQLMDLGADCGGGTVDSCDKHYLLMNDIDMEEDASFSPIGDNTNAANHFSGSFLGQSHKIHRLKVSGTDEVGLFGAIENATISSLELVDADISGNNNVGGIVGSGTGTNHLEKLKVQGSITSSGGVAGGIAANLVGVNQLLKLKVNVTLNGNSTVVGGVVGLLVMFGGGQLDEAHARVDISNCNSSCGGIVGIVNGGTITNSISEGTVSGGSEVGGLIGQSSTSFVNYFERNTAHANVIVTSGNGGGFIGYMLGGATIRNNYATGSISGGGANLGGFAGTAQETSGTIIVEKNFARGAVNGNSGFVANIIAGTFADNVWDSTTSGDSSAGVDNQYEPRTSANMIIQTQFENPALNLSWDFSDTWIIIPGDNHPSFR